MRKKIVAGNWKMNMNLQEGLEFIKSIDKYFKEKPSRNAGVIICVPFIHLAGAAEILKKGPVALGAQNCASEPSGAYTGEVSPSMIRSTGASYVILGHSERRIYFHEDDALLSRKTALAVSSGLNVIFCCGEVKEEREKGNYFDVVKRQLQNGLFTLPPADMAKTVIAYEPVWAIGTGLTASPEQAQEMHQYIRKLVRDKYGDEIAARVSVLYGGSCKPSNASDIFSKPDVDGGLIGGASLKKEDFTAIAEAL
jgi:triosephosphate isomerase